jgi:hypothetical protein
VVLIVIPALALAGLVLLVLAVPVILAVKLLF